MCVFVRKLLPTERSLKFKFTDEGKAKVAKPAVVEKKAPRRVWAQPGKLDVLTDKVPRPLRPGASAHAVSCRRCCCLITPFDANCPLLRCALIASKRIQDIVGASAIWSEPAGAIAATIEDSEIQDIFSRVPGPVARPAAGDSKGKAAVRAALLDAKRAHLLSISIKSIKASPVTLKDSLLSLSRSQLTTRDVEARALVLLATFACLLLPVCLLARL